MPGTGLKLLYVECLDVNLSRKKCNMSYNVTTRGFDVKAFKVASTKTSRKTGYKSKIGLKKTNIKFAPQLN